jgi:hypothetical protein
LAFCILALLAVLHAECGDYLTANTTLAGDMHCPLGHGIAIGADNVVLDCAGHTISGINLSGSIGIYASGKTNATIRNCNLEWFEDGICFSNQSNSSISGSNVSGGGGPGFSGISVISGSSGNAIDNVDVATGAGVGVLFRGGGAKNNVLSDSTITSGAANAVFMDYGTSDTSVVNVSAFSEFDVGPTGGGGAFFVSSAKYNRIDNCSGFGINGYGIDIRGGSNSVTNSNGKSVNKDGIIIAHSGANDNIVQNSTGKSENRFGMRMVEGRNNSFIDSIAVSGSKAGAFGILLEMENDSTLRNVSAISYSSYALYLGGEEGSRSNNITDSYFKSDSNTSVAIGTENSDNWSMSNFFANNTMAGGGIALDIAEKSAGNVFLNNSIGGKTWVRDKSGRNVYNDSKTGNAYVYPTGKPSFESDGIFDLGNDSFADLGAHLPYGHGTLGDRWDGFGEDCHPYTRNSPAVYFDSLSNLFNIN